VATTQTEQFIIGHTPIVKYHWFKFS